MLSFAPISSSPLSALPDYLLNAFQISFTATGTFESFPLSRYQQLMTSSGVIYTVQISGRVIRNA